MANVKHFSGTQELKNIFAMPNAQFALMFPGVKGIRADSFSRYAGQPVSGFGGMMPVERMITYKSFPSRHECNSKCMNGRHNGTCECSCGGKNHGIGAVLGALAV